MDLQQIIKLSISKLNSALIALVIALITLIIALISSDNTITQVSSAIGLITSLTGIKFTISSYKITELENELIHRSEKEAIDELGTIEMIGLLFVVASIVLALVITK